MLFLWMSIICMIPFDMARLDSNAQTATGEVREPTMLRILNIGKVKTHPKYFMVNKLEG